MPLRLRGDRVLFEFFDPGELRDGEMSLELVETRPWQVGLDGVEMVPAYVFDIRVDGCGDAAGRISFRVGNTERILRYAGHIGYAVERRYRGHRYAARACRLLLPLARRHGFKALWITCNPENGASRRTCELAGARFVDISDVSSEPDATRIYRPGERIKFRYRLDL